MIMNKQTFAFFVGAACLTLAAQAQINFGFGGPDGVRVSLGPTPPPPPPPPAPAAVVVQPAPVVVQPAPVVVAPAPAVVVPAPAVVVPEYGYGWYGESWVPTYNGWYYCNSVWCWGGVGPRPMHGPAWRPDPRRPVPARPDRRGYNRGGNWQRGQGIDRDRERRMDRDRRDSDRW